MPMIHRFIKSTQINQYSKIIKQPSSLASVSPDLCLFFLHTHSLTHTHAEREANMYVQTHTCAHECTHMSCAHTEKQTCMYKHMHVRINAHTRTHTQHKHFFILTFLVRVQYFFFHFIETQLFLR